MEVSHELAIYLRMLLCEFGNLGGGSGLLLVLVPVLSFIHCRVAASIDVMGEAEALARWTCDYSRAQVDLLGFSGHGRSQEALLSRIHERLFCLQSGCGLLVRFEDCVSPRGYQFRWVDYLDMHLWLVQTTTVKPLPAHIAATQVEITLTFREPARLRHRMVVIYLWTFRQLVALLHYLLVAAVQCLLVFGFDAHGLQAVFIYKLFRLEDLVDLIMVAWTWSLVVHFLAVVQVKSHRRGIHRARSLLSQLIL